MPKRYLVSRDPLFALGKPAAGDSRQVLRRKVIVQRKNGKPRWALHHQTPGGSGPTPRRPARPKAHRWLQL